MFWRDTWTIFRRQMILSLRNPAWVLIGLMQPIMYLALFGPLLQRVAEVPGFPPGDSWKVFVPGLLVQLGIFGGFFVGFAVIAEWRAGVVDRMLVSPAPRGALILGRVLRDVVSLTVQGAVLMAVATAFGLSVPAYVFVLALILVAFLGGAFSAFSYAAGLALKSEDAFAPLINMFALPVLLLSGILLPMTLAPRWLQIVSDFNPFKHVVEALRAVFLGDVLTLVTAFGFGLVIALFVLGLWLGARVFSGQVK
ncbi:ABC transporter permease [Pseudoroseicyclus sp. CXY001]|uniref:ABC transporter permease n=1 Tax=Pseudoroseicyclus sp. CXY001 TaxID=3242492 RepID=UPI00358DA1D9